MNASTAGRRRLIGEPTAAEIVEIAARDWLDVSPLEASELEAPVASLLGDDRRASRPSGSGTGRAAVQPVGRRVGGRQAKRTRSTSSQGSATSRGSDDGPLTGRTVGVKDNIDVAGVPTTNASATCAYTPTSDAVVVERILKAGGRIIGKLNMDDYASGATGETSVFGPPLNPLDPTRSAGGSAGGSGAALRCGAVDFALGGDQGGSARIPGSYCGVVALKATHGLIPSHGMTHLGHTIDFVCPMARTVTDVAVLLGVIAGEDWRDPQWVRGPIVVDDYLARLESADLAGTRVGVVREGIRDDLCEARVAENLQTTAETLRAHGASVDTISVPLWEQGAKITQTLLCHLTSAMIRSEGEGRDHLGLIDVERLASFAVKRRTQGGLFPPYIKAWLVTDRYLQERFLGIRYGALHNQRLRLMRSIDEALDGYDVLLTPTTPTTPPQLLKAGSPEEIVNRVLGSAPYNTAPLNLSGHPALAVPNGVDPEGMPTSAQVIGRRFDEISVLQLDRIIESEDKTSGGKQSD